MHSLEVNRPPCQDINFQYLYSISVLFTDRVYKGSVDQLDQSRIQWENEMQRACEVSFYEYHDHNYLILHE